MSEYTTYRYRGRLIVDGNVVDRYYEAETSAKTSKQARSNIIYNYRKEKGIHFAAKIELPDPIESIRRYKFKGVVELQGKPVYVGYEDEVIAWDEGTAWAILKSRYANKNFVSEEAQLNLKGELKGY